MSIDALYFVPDKQIQEVEEETSKDATLQRLKQVITEGWPSKKTRHSLMYTTVL